MSNSFLKSPTATQTSYIRSGRGGAGNFHSASKIPQSTITTPAATTTKKKSGTRRFFTGIGGAGNAHKAAERPTINLDDEIRRVEARDAQPEGHYGIGGAGNVFRQHKDGGREGSVSSVGSGAWLLAGVRGRFSRD